jgi:hypothetical protein
MCVMGSAMKMEAGDSSETLVTTYENTRLHLLKDSNIHSHSYEN